MSYTNEKDFRIDFSSFLNVKTFLTEFIEDNQEFLELPKDVDIEMVSASISALGTGHKAVYELEIVVSHKYSNDVARFYREVNFTELMRQTDVERNRIEEVNKLKAQIKELQDQIDELEG